MGSEQDSFQSSEKGSLTGGKFGGLIGVVLKRWVEAM